MFRSIVEAILLDAALGVMGASAATVGSIALGGNPDAIWGTKDCSAAAGSTTVMCAGAHFIPADRGKVFILDDAGSNSGTRVPLVTTIGSIVSATSVTLANATVFAVPIGHISTLNVDPANRGSGYSFGSTQTLACSGGTPPCALAAGGVPSGPAGVAAVGTPAVMAAITAVLPSPSRRGSGGMPAGGTCTVVPTDQITLGGNGTSITVSLSSTGTVAGVLGIVNNGLAKGINAGTPYLASGAYVEPVSGCGSLSGAALNISYAVVLEQITHPSVGSGLYAAFPGCTGSTSVTTTSSDHGTMLYLFCSSVYSSTASWGTDNVGAFTTAIATMNADSAASTPRCISVPAGNYLTSILSTTGSVVTNGAIGYGCWLGDEHNHSNIFVIPNLQGDLFAWADAGSNGSLPDLANTQTFSDTSGNANQGGAAFRNISIIGDRASTTPQNGLMFYGKNDHVYIDNIIVSYMKGHGLGAGYKDNGSKNWGSLNESVIQNARFEHDGDTGSVAAVDITANNTEGSNNLNLVNLRLYQSMGPGLWIHNGTSVGNNARGIRISNLKIEGSQVSNIASSEGYGGDLFEIGDPGTTATGVVDVLCRNAEFVNPVFGFAALHIAGANPANASGIDCAGMIDDSGAFARGVQIDTGQQDTFTEANNGATDYGLLVGTLSAAGTCSGANLAAPGIIYDGRGAETNLARCVDPTVASLVQSPARQLLAQSPAQSPVPARPFDQVSSAVTATTSTTLAFGTAVPANVTAPLWSVVRSGPTAGFIDTWDTANNIVAAITASGGANYAAPGQTYRIRICNQTSVSEALQAPTGSGIGSLILSGGTTLTAGSCGNYALELQVTSSTATVTIVGG